MTYSVYQWRIDKETHVFPKYLWKRATFQVHHMVLSPPQMVRGVRSQTDLEEEGASCQVLARHALSRWTQAWRWAWGERTTVAADLNNHHHQKTNFLGPPMCGLNVLRGCRDNLCSLGGAWRVCQCCFFVIESRFEQLLFIAEKRSDLFPGISHKRTML